MKKILCTLLLAATAVVTTTAQNGTMTPYSRYGYGILGDNATASQRQMGGVGYAMHSGRHINVMNPASYARIDSMTFLFDMGMDLTSLWSKETDAEGKKLSSNDFGGGLDYIAMEVPIVRGLGASIGLLPYSSVGYAFGNTIENGATTRTGSGSINELYLGLGYMPFKNFSVGLNAAYLFGTTYNDSYASTVGGSTSIFERQLQISDWYLNIGAQYSLPMRRGRDLLTIGAVFSPAKNFHGHTNTFSYDQGSETAPTETEESIDGRYSAPMTFGAGVGYTINQRLHLELDGTYQPWSKARYDGATGTLNNRYKLAAGLEWQPNPRGSYMRRVHYRCGGFYDRDYLRVRNNNIRSYGVAAGVGFPVPGFKTIVNLGLEWRRRQGTPNALIREDYLNITIGVNFNEMWFRPNKIY